MNKRHLHHVWTKFRLVKPWYFLILFLVSGLIFVFAIRHNYATMVKLKEAVYQADEENGDVEGALKNLRNYVYHHMNTDLSSGNTGVYPPIQLKYSYDRAVKAESTKTADSNSQIYTDAQHYCEAKIPTGFSGRYRISCIQSYIKQHNSRGESPIPDSLYKFDFISAKWSPDLAGWSLVVAVLSGLAFIISFIADRWFRKHIA
jgi:hypothetical protein